MVLDTAVSTSESPLKSKTIFESLNTELLTNAPALWQYRLSKVTQPFIAK